MDRGQDNQGSIPEDLLNNSLRQYILNSSVAYRGF
jgi:hypothetical protein